MTAHRPVRIALLGTGQYGRGVHLPLLRELPEFEVTTVFSRTLANAAAAAAELPGDVRATDDLASLWSDPRVEAVDVALPIPQLAPVVRSALAAGRHVLSEKPVALDVATGSDLVHWWRETSDRVWMVAENWRYEEAFVHAAACVEGGAIGDPVTATWAAHVPIRPGHRYHDTAWRRAGQVPYGFLQDAGVHYVAVLRALLGEVVAVRALDRAVHDDLPPRDTLAATLAFASGALAQLTLSFAVGSPWPSVLHVTGTAGALAVDRDRVVLHRDGATTERAFPDHTGVRGELRAFARAVRDGAPHANTPEEALADLRVVEAWRADARR